MFQKFSPEGRQVVVLTQEESRALGHDYIGTEHILLALIRADDSIAAQALASLGLDLHNVRDEVIKVIGRGAGTTGGHIPFTSRAKKILELSLREAIGLGHDYIGSEHLLLGLLREGEGVGAQVLNDLGIELEPVRARIVEMVGKGEHPLPERMLSIPESLPGIRPTRDRYDPALGSVIFVLVALVAIQIESPSPEVGRWGLALLLGGVLLWAAGSLIGTESDAGRRTRGAGRYLRSVGTLILAAAAAVFVLNALLG